jgi:hypothetical protein
MRKMKLFTAAAIMALALSTVGCGGKAEESNSMLSIVIEDEKVCEIELSDTAEDSSVSSAALVIADGEALVIEPSLEEGDKALIQMKSGAENESIDAVPDMSNPDYEITVEGNEAMQYSLNPGSYRVNVLPEKGTNGTITMTVQAAGAATETDAAVEAGAETETVEAGAAEGHTNWTEAATAEEAAQGAGLDSLADLNGVKISLGELGTMGSVTYRYMDGVVQIFCPAAAVEMSAIKGKVPAGDGDVSFDSTAYAHEWTQDVDGQEVKCFGNREGEATKTIWTDGEYNYAVLAYGAGGDDDFGLQPEDVAIMVNALK